MKRWIRNIFALLFYSISYQKVLSVCPYITQPVYNGQIEQPENASSGDEVKVTCRESYQINNGSRMTTVKCQSDGTWSGQIMNCKPKKTSNLVYYFEHRKRQITNLTIWNQIPVPFATAAAECGVECWKDVRCLHFNLVFSTGKNVVCQMLDFPVGKTRPNATIGLYEFFDIKFCSTFEAEQFIKRPSNSYWNYSKIDNGELAANGTDATLMCNNGLYMTDGKSVSYSKVIRCIDGLWHGGENIIETCLDDPDICMLESPCENKGVCVDGLGPTYVCNCAVGYGGQNCTDPDICVLETPCKSNGICTDGIGPEYVCNCTVGYSGMNCSEPDVCVLEKPCENNGICIGGPGLQYICTCVGVYVGPNCSKTGEVLLIGGWFANNTMEIYDTRYPESNRILDQHLAEGRHYPVCGVFSDGTVVIVAGYNNVVGGIGIQIHNAKTEVYNPKTGQIGPGPNMNELRDYTAAAMLNDQMIVCGGWNEKEKMKTCEKLVFNATSNEFEWKTFSSMNQGRYLHTMVQLNDSLFVMGGAFNDKSTERYTTANGWSYVAPMIKGHWKHAATVLNGFVYVCGGQSEFNTCEKYNSVSDEWSEVHSMNTQKFEFNLVSLHGRLYAFGGYWSQKLVESYNPETNSWINMTEQLKVRRKMSTAVHLK